MSVFGRATFSAAGYAAARPSYPPSLFKTLLSYHQGKTSKGSFLVDLGCGHGLVARELAPHFGKTLGTDPSAGMVKQATEMTKDPRVSFEQGSAEDLSPLPDQSVDMVVAGQSAHWYDYSKVWPELRRVVRPGGTMGFFGYKDNMLVGHTRANQIMDQFCYSEGEVAPGVESMNPYWEQPGRNKVRNLLREVVPPASDWKDVDRRLYDVAMDVQELPDEETAWMRKKLNLGGLEGYLRTFSCYQGWRDAHPEVKSRAEGGQGDIVDLLLDRMIESEPTWREAGEGWRDVEVETAWGTYILLARRREG
ncbi:methyltransferase domain-containing protein [Sarocladium implicatum]|nr:methyltransferase domain-containing protein [Sarocladium implicatum]